ncbi:MAG TPA: outer membrane lipoprotein-sorting protein [Polyangiaceae bacterium]|nr:outer membrane lipoprotein-sorting protein [Polyangiaceae bacterium]
MKTLLGCILGIVLLAGVALATSPEQAGLAVSKRVDSANDGWGSERATLEMVLVNAHGDRTKRKLSARSIEVDADGDRSLIEFDWPPDVKGTRILTWTHKKGDDDQWLFLPVMNRVKRISGGNKSGSFMGSEFAYEDLSSHEIEKYKHWLLGEPKLEARKTWKLQRVPLDTRSGYKRLVVWLDQEYMGPLRIDYYDRKDELLKTATFSGYQKFDAYWRAGSVSMVNHQTKKQSHLTFLQRHLNARLKAQDFESDALAE